MNKYNEATILNKGYLIIILAAKSKPILKNKEIDIPIFNAILWSLILLKFLVIDAKATALSAERIISRIIKTGSTDAISDHWSILSNIGVSDCREAESIYKRLYSWNAVSYILMNKPEKAIEKR